MLVKVFIQTEDIYSAGMEEKKTFRMIAMGLSRQVINVT